MFLLAVKLYEQLTLVCNMSGMVPGVLNIIATYFIYYAQQIYLYVVSTVVMTTFQVIK